MKTKFGAVIVAGSGKVGGHVASHNRGGAYLRTKVTPVNPNTSYQAGVRNRLATIATSWKGLTAAQRLNWNGAVSLLQGYRYLRRYSSTLWFQLVSKVEQQSKPRGRSRVNCTAASCGLGSYHNGRSCFCSCRCNDRDFYCRPCAYRLSNRSKSNGSIVSRGFICKVAIPCYRFASHYYGSCGYHNYYLQRKIWRTSSGRSSSVRKVGND